jgi:cell division protein FtsB
MKISNRISIILAVLMLLFGGASFYLFRLYLSEVKDKNRIENSFAAANQQLKYYTTRDGQLAAKIDVLQLRYNELKGIYPEIIAEIKNLKINPRQVNNYSETVIKQEKDIVAKIRDSIIFDTVPVRVFNYHDEFYTVRGIAIGDTQKVHIESRDSLIQIVFKGERYKPWLWIFSRRKLQQVVRCKNPNAKILYSKSIIAN